MEVDEFLQLLHNNNKMKEISLSFRQIDPDRTGYLTSPELDDLFRYYYPDEFKDKHMFEIVKPFEIISNKILVEYGKFRKWLVMELKKTQSEHDSSKLQHAKEVLSSRQAARSITSTPLITHLRNESTSRQ